MSYSYPESVPAVITGNALYAISVDLKAKFDRKFGKYMNSVAIRHSSNNLSNSPYFVEEMVNQIRHFDRTEF